MQLIHFPLPEIFGLLHASVVIPLVCRVVRQRILIATFRPVGRARVTALIGAFQSLVA